METRKVTKRALCNLVLTPVGDNRSIDEFFKLLQKKLVGKASAAAEKKKTDKVVNPLFEKRPKKFGIGVALPPKRNLTQFVKLSKVIQIHRKKRILKYMLKVPPALNQFTKTLYKSHASNLFKMLVKYRPEDKAAKRGTSG